MSGDLQGSGRRCVDELQLQVAIHQVVLLQPPQALADLAGLRGADAVDASSSRSVARTIASSPSNASTTARDDVVA